MIYPSAFSYNKVTYRAVLHAENGIATGYNSYKE